MKQANRGAETSPGTKQKIGCRCFIRHSLKQTKTNRKRPISDVLTVFLMSSLPASARKTPPEMVFNPRKLVPDASFCSGRCGRTNPPQPKAEWMFSQTQDTPLWAFWGHRHVCLLLVHHLLSDGSPHAVVLNVTLHVPRFCELCFLTRV